jgi:NADH dehydrogenase
MSAKLSRIVVVGAGFGGLIAVRSLAKTPAEVILIDRQNYHLFQPLLYQVATAALSPDDIAHPVRSMLRGQHNLEFRLADVTGMDFNQRLLHTSTGDVTYDYLILANGGVTNFYGLKSVQQYGFGLKSLEDAVAIRDHLLRMFELAAQETDINKRRALLTFVVVGGGPTGVECSGAISELIRMVLRRDFRFLDFTEVRIILLEAADRLLADLPEKLNKFTAETLKRKQVEVHFGSVVAGFDGQQVQLKSGELIPACTLIWAAGVRAAPVVDQAPTAKGSQGRVKIGPTLQMPEHPEVFVIGDSAYLETTEGHPLPMVAPVAMQQAAVATRNIALMIAGRPVQKFVYRDPGSLATIGRNAAVARLGRWQFTGFFAWLVWLVVHLYQLIGFRNRLVVLINWAWDYIFYDRPIRLILPSSSNNLADGGSK